MTSIAVCVAGSDASGGAGIQADLKTFSALGVYGASIITALTSQNTKGVSSIHTVPGHFVREQMVAVFSDLDVKAVKIGMLFNADNAKAVASELETFCKTRPIVLDPVMIATSGDPLLVDDAVGAMKAHLFPLVSLITPNLQEAAHLTSSSVAYNETGMMKQAEQLVCEWGMAVLIKGGHRQSKEARDCFFDGNKRFWLSSRRYATQNTHGTGCTLSSAITALLAKGETMEAALFAAKDYVSGAIAKADDLCIGTGRGPVHHFHSIW